MKNRIDSRSLHNALFNLFGDELATKVDLFIKDYSFPADTKYRKKIYDALALLEKEKVGGIHALLERITAQTDILEALKKEMMDASKDDFEKFSAHLAFKRAKETFEDEHYRADWNELRNKWGFLFVPDVFYPGKYTLENISKWTYEFVRFFLRKGITGIIDLYKNIGNVLAGYHIDCIYDGYPIIYYSLANKAEIQTDQYGRTTKVFSFPLRFTRKEILQSVDSFNKALEEQICGEELILKKVGVIYKYSWGMKPPYKKVRKKILHGWDWTEIFSYRDRNKIVIERFNELKEKDLSDMKCYDILAKQFRRSPITIRQIVKKREKLA